MHHLRKLLQFIDTHQEYWLRIFSLLKSEPTFTLPKSQKSHIFKGDHLNSSRGHSIFHCEAKTPHIKVTSSILIKPCPEIKLHIYHINMHKT